VSQDSREERKAKVIEALNGARSMELHAIHQYMVQHYNLDNMDYGEMAKSVKLIAIDEMRHAEMLADRVEELGGQPTSDLAAIVQKGQGVEAIFPFDIGLEDEAIDYYNRYIQVCRDCGDHITLNLLQGIMEEEQVHLTYFDNVNNHVKQLGQVYLARIAGTPSSTGLQTQGFVARQQGMAGQGGNPGA
jgi:bacterioferritin